jgi:hypothetical protein
MRFPRGRKQHLSLHLFLTTPGHAIRPDARYLVLWVFLNKNPKQES